jgi:hypothetical protein
MSCIQLSTNTHFHHSKIVNNLVFFSFLLNTFISLFTQLFIVNVLQACEILFWFLFSMWVIEFHLSKIWNCTYIHSFLQCTCTCYTHNGHYWLCSLHFYTDIPTAFVNVFYVVVHRVFKSKSVIQYQAPLSVLLKQINKVNNLCVGKLKLL